MVGRLRQIFLTQYIGAIVIAFLTVQGIVGLIGMVTMTLAFYFESKRQPAPSIFQGPTEPPGFAWNALLVSIVAVGLHFLSAYVLLRWLYLRGAPMPPRAAEDGNAGSSAGEEQE